MKKSIKTRMKSCISRIVLTAGLVFTVGVPVYAANLETSTVKSSTPYVDFNNLVMYNGVVAYTGSGQNYSNTAYVSVTASSLGYSNVAAYDTIGQMTSNMYSMDTPGNVTISPAIKYPGQYIRVGFSRTGISGSNYVTGKFYYNGL